MISGFLISILAFVIVLSIVVFIHEFGHYIIAILNNVKVDEFSIGYGKELVSIVDKRGTKWKICILPFGGFVKFFGDEDASSSTLNTEKLNKFTDEDKKKCLYFKNVYQRIAVVVAGPIFNYILAFCLFFLFFLSQGVNKFSNKITHIVDNSPAQMSGLKIGDEVIEMDGKKVNDFSEIQFKVFLSITNPIEFTIKRDGELKKVVVIPKFEEKINENNKKTKTPFIGIGSNEYKHVKIGVLESLGKAAGEIHRINTSTLKALGQMIVGKRGLDDMSGPIKIAKYSGDAMKNGFLSLIYFMALISASLGLMNLLPIPVLDGGHLLFYIIEIIRRKPLSEKIENMFVRIGFSILITLMIFVSVKDILGIF